MSTITRGIKIGYDYDGICLTSGLFHIRSFPPNHLRVYINWIGCPMDLILRWSKILNLA